MQFYSFSHVLLMCSYTTEHCKLAVGGYHSLHLHFATFNSEIPANGEASGPAKRLGSHHAYLLSQISFEFNSSWLIRVSAHLCWLSALSTIAFQFRDTSETFPENFHIFCGFSPSHRVFICQRMQRNNRHCYARHHSRLSPFRLPPPRRQRGGAFVAAASLVSLTA